MYSNWPMYSATSADKNDATQTWRSFQAYRWHRKRIRNDLHQSIALYIKFRQIHNDSHNNCAAQCVSILLRLYWTWGESNGFCCIGCHRSAWYWVVFNRNARIECVFVSCLPYNNATSVSARKQVSESTQSVYVKAKMNTIDPYWTSYIFRKISLQIYCGYTRNSAKTQSTVSLQPWRRWGKFQVIFHFPGTNVQSEGPYNAIGAGTVSTIRGSVWHAKRSRFPKIPNWSKELVMKSMMAFIFKNEI